MKSFNKPWPNFFFSLTASVDVAMTQIFVTEYVYFRICASGCAPQDC